MASLSKEFENAITKISGALFGARPTFQEIINGYNQFKTIQSEIDQADAINSPPVDAYVDQFDVSRPAKGLLTSKVTSSGIYAEVDFAGYILGSAAPISNSTALEVSTLDADSVHSGMGNVSYGLVIEDGKNYTEIEPYAAGIKTGTISSSGLGITHTEDGVQIIEGGSSVINEYNNNGITIFNVVGTASSSSPSQSTNSKLLSKINDFIGSLLGATVTGTHESAASTLENLVDKLPTSDLSVIDKAIPYAVRAHGGVLAAIPEIGIAIHEYESGNTSAGEADLSEAVGGAILGAALPVAVDAALATVAPSEVVAPVLDAALSVVGYGVGAYLGHTYGPSYLPELNNFISGVANTAH